MEKIVIEIECFNEAFENVPNYEIARILKEVAARIENYETPSILRDINGNKVGSVEFL